CAWRLRVALTGLNGSGSATASSAQTTVVIAALAAPANTAVPTISGTGQAGATLTATSGTWTGNPAPTLSYQWRRCDSAGATCADIVGEIATTYMQTATDVGSTVRVAVTGLNGSG